MRSAPGSKIWEHAVETVLLLEVGALAAVAVLPHTHVHAWVVPTVCGISGAITAFVIWCLTGSARFSFSALAMAAFLSGWTAWAQAVRLWHPAALVAWLASVTAFIPLMALTAAHARDKPEEEAKAEAAKPDPDAEKAEEMGKFEHMFSELGLDGVQVMDLVTELGGRVVRIALPRSGKVTIDDLDAVAKRIGVILRMKGGKIEFEEGDHSGDVLMRLRERDFLGATIPLRAEYRAHTINKPFAIGIQEDGQVASITLRELHARIIGTTGAGKSNLINVILAQLSGMVDTVIWVIDMKGGRVARPWLHPFADGKATVPGIDWVATTREEASLMMHCFVKAVEYRMNSGIGGEKIVPSASMPQIVLVCDEMADLFGINRGSRKEVGAGATTNFEFIRLGEDVTQKGRSEAAATVWASQRGTNSMSGSGDMKANCKLTIMLGMTQESEARYANADNKVAAKRASAMVDVKGGGTITMGRKSSLTTKFFRLGHPEKPGTETDETLCDNGCIPACPVYRAAMETASIRPPLDRGTAAAMGDDYAQRWTRAENLLRRPVPVGPAGAGPRLVTVDTGSFDDIMAGGGFEDPEAKLNPQQKRTLDILSARGVRGATPTFLMGELQKTGDAPGARETLQRWLSRFEEKGLVHNASYGRWVIGPDPSKSKDESAA